jgi:outer membrane usher protein
MMDGGFFPTNRVHDTFVLVSTDRHPGIPVLFENRLVGRTNRHGHLLVPGGTSYYPSRYEIDPLNLDPDLRAAVVERLVSVRKNSGATLSFPIRRVVAAVVALVDDAGIPLPFGTIVMHEESGVRAVVGWEGLVYFEDLREANHLAVMTASGRRCSVAFPMNLSNRTMTRVGPLRCLPQEVGP